MSEELRPCPFCKCTEIVAGKDYTRGNYRVDCLGCSAFITAPSLELAIHDWNTRPIEDELRTRIAELEEKQRWRVVANGELPKKNDYYWARDDFGEQGRILFYDGEWNKFTNLSYITHWMPLPELPEMTE